MNEQKKDIVLIVDDQPASLKILLSFLQNQDFDLRILQSGEQAVAILSHFIPDIILLDVLMPDMDGFETCRRIKKSRAVADVPVIFMTALNSVEDKITGFEAGGVDYITKPFQQAEVLARVNTHLSLRKRTLKLRTTQERLRHQKIMLESLLNSIPDPIYFKDFDNKYLGCNRAFEEFAGKKEQEILGKTDESLFSEETAASFRSKDQEMLKLGAASRTEEPVCYPDGRQVLFDVLKTPYIGPDGNLLGLIGICRNITDLKNAELRAEEERERLSVTLHSIGDGVISTDVAGRVVCLNKVAEQLTGWNNAEAVGRQSEEIFRVINEKTGRCCADPVSQALELGSTVNLENNAVLIRPDGTRLSVADSCAPIRDQEGRMIGAVIVFRDVTNEKKTIAELIKMKKLESVGLLAGGIAHDFNNILSAILGNIELAAAQISKDADTVALLSDAHKATERAAKLTRQLLTFSKGGEPVREKTSLIDLVRESADFVLHGSSVSCEYVFADGLWLINADSGQISQVIQNMILNAKYAMPAGGKIRIECSNAEGAVSGSMLNPGLHAGSFVRIAIQDEGIGIPPEIMDKIFDPYFTTRPDGNGLGLAICHSIIKKHDGYITVQSEPGKGAEFIIYLPAACATDMAAAEQKTADLPVQGAKIMVMDDDRMLRDLAKAQLHSLGHEAVLVADGEEAISTYRQLLESGSPADLVIMDLTIPGGMGGREAAQQLLRIHPQAKLIVASGYSNDPVLADYRTYGFRAAVAKPFNLKELKNAIAAAL